MENRFEIVFETVCGSFSPPIVIAAQNFRMAAMIADTMIEIGHCPFDSEIVKIRKIRKCGDVTGQNQKKTSPNYDTFHPMGYPGKDAWQLILENMGYNPGDVDLIELQDPDRIIGFVTKIALAPPSAA